jgi:FixJ family two-component response regulator
MSNEQIAVVDDDASVRKGLSRLLEAYSYRVRTYEGVQQFIDSLPLQVPECLILDLNMKPKTGLEVLHVLTDNGTRVPTIILTGEDEPERRERCQRAGAVAFLVKPVSVDQLLRAIRTALSTRVLH